MKDLTEEDLPKPLLVEDLGMMFATKNSKHKVRFGIYKCGFCGTEFKACTYHILSGHTKSCGCYHKRRMSETHKTHGLGTTRLYNIWSILKDRVLGDIVYDTAPKRIAGLRQHSNIKDKLDYVKML